MPFSFGVENSSNEEETLQNEEISNPQIFESETKRQFKIYHSKFKKSKLKAKTSPKLEHLKSKVKAEENLNVRKKEFQQRKAKELMRLDKEYEVLDYKP